MAHRTARVVSAVAAASALLGPLALGAPGAMADTSGGEQPTGARTLAAAVAAYDVQANRPQVAGDAGSDSTARFPTNKQNETSIAVNPIAQRYLVAGANDEQRQPACGPGPVRGPSVPASDCSFFPGVGTSGVYTSDDGGQTWTNRGLLDDQPSWAGLGVISDGDPVIAYGPKPDGTGGFSYAAGARAYYSSLATITGGKGYEYIVIAWSDDDGHTWSAPVIGTTKTSNVDFNDKNWISVDTSPSSPHFGQVYLTWTEFRSATSTGNGSEPVMVAVSRDGGLSFGSPKQLSPAGNNGTGNGRQGSTSTVGPDGTVYVGFEQGSDQVVSISRDGGSSWTRPASMGAVREIADPIPGATFRTNSFPMLAADPRVGSTVVYAAWATRVADADGADTGRIVVVRSADAGRTWGAPVEVSGGGEGYAFFPGLDVAANGRVDLGYQALQADDPHAFGTGNATIDAWYRTSTDGLLWSQAQRVSTTSSDPAASAQNNLQRQFWGDYNTLVSGDEAAWFVYTDSRNGVGCAAVDAYQRYLVDTGAVVRGDMADRLQLKTTGVNPAATPPSEKPAPPTACPDQYGNTDVYVSVLDPTP